MLKSLCLIIHFLLGEFLLETNKLSIYLSICSIFTHLRALFVF